MHSASQVAPAVGIGWRHPHHADLLNQRPALDFIEVHSENFFGDGGAALALLSEARCSYPVSLHGVGLALGSAAGVDFWHLDQLVRLVDRIEPVRVSDHACFARAPVEGAIAHAADLLPLPFRNDALAVMCDNVQQVQDRLCRPLLVENLSTYLTWSSSEMDEPAFLVALAKRTGCQLLVDVNNLYVNALNAQLQGATEHPEASVQRWLDAIPPSVVGELHLAGHCRLEDIVIDDHGCRVAEAVWRLYRHALRCFGAVPTLVEWDTELPPFEVLLGEAHQARCEALDCLTMPVEVTG